MNKVKIAVLGCGFWSRFQIGGWLELPNVEIVALYNRTIEKANSLAKEFGIKYTYNDAELLLQKHPEIEVVDIITDVFTHPQFVHLAAKYKKHVICQKPMAPDFESAKKNDENHKRSWCKILCT